MFHLTQSLLLTPNDIPTYNPDGTIDWDRGERINFRLTHNCMLIFDLQFRFEEANSEGVAMHPELIARFEGANDVGLDQYLDLIDDLLLLVSLAEGQRCSCLEVTWSQGNESSHRFRMNRSFPYQGPHHSFNDFLIEEEFAPFLECGFATFQSHPQKDLLRNALQSLTYFEPTTISEDYLRLFTALEAVLLAYRRTAQLEFIIPDEAERKLLEEDLKAFLKTHPLLKDRSEVRGLLYRNLKALDRVPLADVLERFCRDFQVDLQDLWPVYGDKEGPSLARLRNQLVHGEFFSDPEWKHIIEAKKCLEVIATRCVLKSLGWDYRGTRAHHLSGQAENRWKSARTQLARKTLALEATGTQ